MKRELERSHSVVSNSLRPHGLYSPWNSSSQNTGVDSLSLLQEIFPTQESNQSLLHCRQILYQLSYQGSHSFYAGAEILVCLLLPLPSTNCPASSTGHPSRLPRSTPQRDSSGT